MEKCIIAAVASDFAIGVRGNLPWHLSEDLRYFKRMTDGFPVIMGHKTFLSIGRPLPGRMNIVLTRSDGAELPEGTVAADSLQKAFALAGASGAGKCFVIGGASVYREALASADKLYITRVFVEVPEADTFFPEISGADWEEESASELYRENDMEFRFAVYNRRSIILQEQPARRER